MLTHRERVAILADPRIAPFLRSRVGCFMGFYGARPRGRGMPGVRQRCQGIDCMIVSTTRRLRRHLLSDERQETPARPEIAEGKTILPCSTLVIVAARTCQSDEFSRP